MILFIEFEVSPDELVELQRLRRIKTVRHGRITNPYTIKELIQRHGQGWKDELRFEETMPISSVEFDKMVRIPPCKLCAE